MSLKSIFKAVHKAKNSTVVGALDLYLLSIPDKDADRAIDINAPSQIGGCLRSRFYARKGYETDEKVVEPRLKRIFDNGSHVHLRLQNYLLEAGVLLLDEVPVLNVPLSIQGHTDGLLDLNKDGSLSVLEIKSIKGELFSKLIGAKPEHIKQGLTYLYCLERRREDLHRKYTDFEAFKADEDNRMEYYTSFYQHLKDGRKFTREQKIAHQCVLHDKADSILMKCEKSITDVHFVYECKDTQQIKEFIIHSTDTESIRIWGEVAEECSALNRYCELDELPPREGTNKSCNTCHWCPYKIQCWN